MDRKQLVRDVKRAALARMESAARTAEDFQAVIEQWDNLDQNRERKERFHEIGRDEKLLELGYSDGMILPVPFCHPAWREAIKGDFIAVIYDNAEEIWQLVEDRDISIALKNLSAKQKEVVFLSIVRLCTPQQIACYKDQTDRAVRKLLTIAIDSIRDYLSEAIYRQSLAKKSDMTLAKRQFLKWYEQEKFALDNDERE